MGGSITGVGGKVAFEREEVNKYFVPWVTAAGLRWCFWR